MSERRRVRVTVTVTAGNLTALLTSPWREVRPGVLTRTAGTADYFVFRQDDLVCQRCLIKLTRLNEAPVIWDEKWRAAFPRDGVCCSACLLAVVGDIALADVIPCAVSLLWVARNRPEWSSDPEFHRFLVRSGGA